MKPVSAAKRPLPEIIRVFSRLGLLAFGGPAAHIAMMEDEVVRKRKWVSKERFIDMLGFTSLIPGPNSTEMAIFLGFTRGGRAGLFLAGACFILPAIDKIRASRIVSNVLDGVNAASIALMAAVTLQLGAAALIQASGIRAPALLIFLASAVLLIRFKVNSTWLILGGGILGFLLPRLGIAI